jgi:hypothetical protein
MDSQFSATATTQHRLLIKLSASPNPGGMARFRLMAVKTGIVALAAAEFDRNDIEPAPVVGAARA